MKKAWEFFWFVVAAVVGGVILISLIKPYMTTIVVVAGIIAVGLVGYRTYKAVTQHRRHF